MLVFTVPPSLTTVPVGDFLRYQCGISLTLWRRIKRNGILTVNEKTALPRTLVTAGDIVRIELTPDRTLTPAEVPLDVRYEDDFLLIVNKPAGLLVHPTVRNETKTLANGVIFYYQQKNRPYGFHPIHRLDRNTSGLLAIAKYPNIQHQLSTKTNKRFQRSYLAIVHGVPGKGSGIIDFPIGRAPDSIIERMVRPDGQSAITHYQVLKNMGQASLLKLELETGRTHQIRVHLAHMGHPILGDDLYGPPSTLIHRQALHAFQLNFSHPVTAQRIVTVSPIPDDMTFLLRFYQNNGN
ncbi:pseudouridine synthase rsua/rlub/c/d/e/f [Lucifera butyrica]|uniref:Pseudouridine synthase n=1 Tax=Lucifera butyrica TaxID=1351585 RepID=A0A498RHR3_9FIRM|nr:RluA family pseudouridine synthase [Lucifera butyrica]VBB08688.1 pseudouridine synthase rsua/rlub/c/d/e/f [Lucifera butyrica]